ncbi:OLC1v1008748C1 [Oldenlandia corymbosa var. corymbosa]|uniref:OLC1v1008748C1 n=1 Tax=Oldenlandia corymbosa var. corymbosa TaxID=529605 RepID=A0AAV1DQN3_OLDCO|nr:OLC1v1008748C1 [Oldenlandia corymbosa var. corymbosa]
MAMNQSSNMQSGRTRRRWRAGIGRRKHGGQISSATFLRIVGNTVKALDWIQKDYEVSERFLPDKDLFPTCNTLGELHLRLENFKEALYYQEKHLEIAEGANNLAEQQRANTQLGRTYHEIFLKSQDNHSAVQNAKKYFILAIELAKNLKENQWSSKSTFLTEYIDAHNNLGMLEIDLNNLEEAESILTKGLEICDEEEVGENDDGRSRLHHNLGLVYMEFRNWKKAEEHIKKDILICESIRHCQGEAKGLINFGELHGRVQKYEEAISCYQKALLMAKSMEDEGALVDQIELNIETVEAAIIVMKELKQGEQNLKRIQRCTEKSKDKACERKYLLQQIELVDLLIQKSSSISAWIEHFKYATIKNKIAERLCDKEKLADSFAKGGSCKKLRRFDEALMWYERGFKFTN